MEITKLIIWLVAMTVLIGYGSYIIWTAWNIIFNSCEICHYPLKKISKDSWQCTNPLCGFRKKKIDLSDDYDDRRRDD